MVCLCLYKDDLNDEQFMFNTVSFYFYSDRLNGEITVNGEIAVYCLSFSSLHALICRRIAHLQTLETKCKYSFMCNTIFNRWNTRKIPIEQAL